MQTSSTPEASAGILSVVMPCYNEANTIAVVIDRVLASPFVGELIVVDDGSSDESLKRVSEIRDSRIRLFSQPHNMGKGAALRRGLLAASLKYVLIQDADLEYDPREYGALLDPLLDGRADVVFGSRFHTQRPHRVLYYWHSVGNRFLTFLSNMATNLNLTDMETCYKVFKREVIHQVVIEEDRFGFEPEITAKVAKGGWVIYEVGISYSGRTYEEGKKIGWRDGVRALYCIARYGLDPSDDARRNKRTLAPLSAAEVDQKLSSVLHNVEGAKNYAAWIYDLIKPYARGRTLEVGAGHGAISQHLVGIGPLTLSDPSDECIERLRERFATKPDVTIVQADVATITRTNTFDTVVMINTLEHIEQDVQTLSDITAALSPDGYLLLLVPASESLYSKFDASVGHHRRYGRGELITRAYQAGLEVVDIRYVNSVGALTWWASAKQLGLDPTSGYGMKFYDAVVVPALKKLEAGAKTGPAFGQSLFMVARKSRTVDSTARSDQSAADSIS